MTVVNYDRRGRGTSTDTVPYAVDGEASPAPILAAARAVADGLPQAQLQTLPGQIRDLVPEVLGPVLEEFYAH